MKQAIWKVDPFGDFSFRGTHSEQMTLGLGFSDYSPLINALQMRFQERGWVSIQDILDYVMSDETDFHSTQVKNNALKWLEEKELIEINPDTRNRVKTYPDGTMIRFV